MWEVVDGMYAPYLRGEFLSIEGDINATMGCGIITTWETTPEKFEEAKMRVSKDLGINLECIPSQNSGTVLCSFMMKGSYLKMKI